MRIFKRVGKKHPQTFIRLKVIPSIGQSEPELHMCDRVRRHQQLEPMNSRKQMARDIAGPHSQIIRKLVVDGRDYLPKESSRPRGRIQNLDSVNPVIRNPGPICQSLRYSEVVLQGLVYASDDKSNNLLRRIINASC